MKLQADKYSILQAICATLIFISYLLPWVRIPVFNEVQTGSVVQIIINMLEAGMGWKEVSTPLTGEVTDGSLWVILLPLIPIAACINAVWQWSRRSPLVAFYLNIIPIGVCIAAVSLFVDVNNTIGDTAHISQIIGIGFYLALAAALTSMANAWTRIGKQYQPTYKKHMRVISLITIAAFVLWLIPIPYVSTVAGAICFVHLPFISYGWIVMLCTRSLQTRRQNPAN